MNDTGATTANFTVTLSSASDSTVTVAYTTANGSALSGTNYTTTSGTLSFTKGQTSQTITVPILADPATHPNETFTVTLSTPSGATIGEATGTGTLLAHTEAAQNQAPILAGTASATLVLAQGAAPAGDTIASLVNPVVLLGPNDTLAGVVVITNASAGDPSILGDWQYSTDGGSHWHDIGMVTATGDGLVLPSTALVRLVSPAVAPTFGLSALGIVAIDSTYAGSFTTGGVTTTPITLNIADTTLGGSSSYSDTGNAILGVFGLPTTWVGGGDSNAFDDSTNWTGNHAPAIGRPADINGSTVSFNNGDSLTGEALQLTGSAALTISNESTFKASAGGSESAGSSLTLNNGGLEVDSGSFTIAGTLTIEGGGDLSGYGTFVDTGTITGINGSIDTYLIIDNGGSLLVENTSSFSSDDPIYIQAGGVLKIADTGTGTDFEADGITNSGSILLELGPGGSTDMTTLRAGEGGLDNLSGGVIEFDKVSGGLGVLTLEGDVTNKAGGAINVNVGATFTGGSLDNYGTITIAPGAVLTIGAVETSPELIWESGATITGTGTLFINSGAGVDLEDNLTIPAGMTLKLDVPGDEDNPDIAADSDSATLIISGMGQFNSADINSNLTVTSGGIITVIDSNGLVSFDQSTTIQSGGTLELSDTQGDGTYLYNDGTITNSGDIKLTGGADDGGVTLDSSSGSIVNLAGGVIEVDMGTETGNRGISGNLTNSGTLQINSDAVYIGSGILDNKGVISIVSTQVFEIQEDTTLIADTGGTFSGAGTLIIEPDGTMNLAAATTVPVGLTLQLGGHEDDPATLENGTLTVDGTVALVNASVSSNLTVASGGTFRVDNEGDTGILESGTVTNIASGGTLQITNTESGTFLINDGAINNSGLIQFTGSVSDVESSLNSNDEGAILRNLSGGVIRFDVGAGGLRVLKGPVDNESGATILLNTSAQYGNGTLTNSGTISLASGKTFAFTGGTLEEAVSGAAISVVSGTATLSVTNGGDLKFDANATLPSGLTVAMGVAGGSSGNVQGSGTVTLDGTLDLNDSDVTAALIVASGGAVLALNTNQAELDGSTTIQSGGVLTVKGTTGTETILTVEGTLDNAGAINLTSTGTVTATALYVSGTINNNTGGVINVEDGSNSTSLQFGGTLDNNGGEINIADSNTLTVDSDTTLEQTSGSFSGSGTLLVADGGTLAVDADFTIPTALTFVVGQSDGATITGTSDTTITVAGALDLAVATVGARLDVESGGVMTMGDGGDVLQTGGIAVETGGVINMKATTNDTTIHLTDGLGNSGTVNLTSTMNSAVTLDMSDSAFSFANNGTLNILAGSGGARTIDAAVNNSGTINVDTNATIGAPYAISLENESGGLITIAAGVTVNWSDGEFKNDSGATLMVASGASLDMNGDNLVNAGTISGSGTINMDGGTYTNTGTSSIVPDPDELPGHLTIDGNAILGAGTHTLIQLAGADPGQFDVFSVTGNIALDGALDLVTYNNFVPLPGDAFKVLTWGTETGTLAAATGLGSFGNMALDPIFSDSGLTLVARTITQHAGAGDQTLVGAAQPNVLVGGSGNDTLVAGPGNDLLIGGTGNTTFVAGAGAERLVGGLGTNIVDFSNQAGPVTINLALGTATNASGSTDTLIGIHNVIGTAYGDTIIDANASDTLTGGGGQTTYEFNGPATGGATITNFTSGRDVVALLQSAFGLGSNITAGQNFSSIQGAFNGTAAGVNANFAAGQPTLVFSQQNDALYYDPHGAGSGYTLVAQLEPGAIVTANDIHLFHGATA